MFYTPDKPCKRGHLGPRLVSNGACKPCQQLWYKNNRDKFRAYNKKWEEDPENREKKLRSRWKGKAMPEPTRPRPEVCECCGNECSRTLANDHDHVTGVFRGWLCGKCNKAIGLLGDNEAGVRKALDYLDRSK